ncbi:MAG: hypothetical protein Q7T40_12575 [Methylobacter sp.]|nr:hypothetical protein [Methylobacter sp.]
MRNLLKLTITLLLCSTALAATKAQAVSIYDGIYSTNPNIGYVYFREQQGQMIAVLNQTFGAPYWSAGQGALNGASVSLTTIIGYTRGVNDVVFTSDSTFQATQTSCVPNGLLCAFPNGTTFTGTKIW